MRLIDKDQLLRDLNTGMNIIEMMQTVMDAKEVKPKVGWWIWDDGVFHCSECLFRAYGNTLECMDGTYRYCPSCGAKMEAER